jgi:hypothetical protein
MMEDPTLAGAFSLAARHTGVSGPERLGGNANPVEDDAAERVENGWYLATSGRGRRPHSRPFAGDFAGSHLAFSKQIAKAGAARPCKNCSPCEALLSQILRSARLLPAADASLPKHKRARRSYCPARQTNCSVVGGRTADHHDKEAFCFTTDGNRRLTVRPWSANCPAH